MTSLAPAQPTPSLVRTSSSPSPSPINPPSLQSPSYSTAPTPVRRSTLTSSNAGQTMATTTTSRQRQRSDELEDGDEAEDEDDDEYYEGAAAGGRGKETTEANEMLNEVTVKAGYLWKKGEKRKNWKKRWFVLRSSKLCYYKNDKEYQLLRFIDMSEVHTVAAIEVKKQDNTFGIVTPKRAYYVKASTPSESHDWILALNHVKRQVSHRNSLSHEMDELRVSGIQTSQPSTASSSTARPAPTRERSRSSSQAAAERAASAAAAATSAFGPPISINIPGKGTYVAPAQPRAISGGIRGGGVASGSGSVAGGSDAFSPLTTTTDSDTGADRYGLSYASSTGLSLGSSPGREATMSQQWSGSELSDPANPRGPNSPPRRGGQASRGISHQGRDVTLGSSGAEGGAGAGNEFAGSYQSSSAAVLSSSEEEDEEADSTEQMDRAMPLPMLHPGTQGGNAEAASSTSVGPATPTQTQSPQLPPLQSAQSQSRSHYQTQTAGSGGGGDALLRDPNRVIIQGYLMKQSNRRKHWRKRWFVLTATKLMYTSSHMDARAHRQIPLTSILDAIEFTAKKGLTPGSPGGFGSPLGVGVGGFSFNALGGGGGGGGGGPDKGEGGANGRHGEHGPEAASTPSNKLERRQSVVAVMASNLNSLGSGSGGSLGGGGGGSSGVGSSGGSGLGSAAGGGGGPPPSSGAASGGASTRRTENSFKIITPKRTFLLCAPSEEEEIKWLSALHALLTRTRDKTSMSSNTGSSGTGTGKGSGAAMPGTASVPITRPTSGIPSQGTSATSADVQPSALGTSIPSSTTNGPSTGLVGAPSSSHSGVGTGGGSGGGEGDQVYGGHSKAQGGHGQGQGQGSHAGVFSEGNLYQSSHPLAPALSPSAHLLGSPPPQPL